MKIALSAAFAAILATQALAAPVTYDFSQPVFPDGETVSGSLTLDLALLAAAPAVTVAELNSLATYTITVMTGVNDFVLTEANSAWSSAVLGSASISATTDALTFDGTNFSFAVTLDDDGAVSFDQLVFVDFGSSLVRIGNRSTGQSLTDLNLGVQSPDFTFNAAGTVVPLPAPALLLLTGLAGLGIAARRRRKA